MKRRSSLFLASLAARVALSALSALALSCGEGRFPVCKSNDECAAKLGDAGTGAKVCYNLRCVECRYDTDCPTGQICNANLNVCKDISTHSTDPEEASTVAPVEGDKSTSGDAKTWDECAARCKEASCVKACDQKFRK